MTTLDFIVAIPARFASVRLPGKPLRLIGDDEVERGHAVPRSSVTRW